MPPWSEAWVPRLGKPLRWYQTQQLKHLHREKAFSMRFLTVHAQVKERGLKGFYESKEQK